MRLLQAKIPYHSLRMTIRPGITGWAQVEYHYGASDEEALEISVAILRELIRQVDAAGARLVIIDKIPFAVPTDPVVAARCASIEAEGGNPVPARGAGEGY